MWGDTGLQTHQLFSRSASTAGLCFPGSTYDVSGSKDAVHNGTAERGDHTEADEDDRCNQLRKENKAKYHLPVHNRAISALSTGLWKAQSMSPGAVSDPDVGPAAQPALAEGAGCVSALAGALCQTGSLGTW